MTVIIVVAVAVAAVVLWFHSRLLYKKCHHQQPWKLACWTRAIPIITRIRRKYPWRRFKAFFLKSSGALWSGDANNNNNKAATAVASSTSVVVLLLIIVTLAIGSSLSLSRQQQQQHQQQQGKYINFAERNVIEHDYFTTDREYVSDYAPINHKCLFVRFKFFRWLHFVLLLLLLTFLSHCGKFSHGSFFSLSLLLWFTHFLPHKQPV
jgi:hypothetical protein